ncbi:MAG: hypothetical protein JWM09_1552 [Francisellaceae bacterium]|nr:hypothetical protein [Francisellaceae bacterium]
MNDIRELKKNNLILIKKLRVVISGGTVLTLLSALLFSAGLFRTTHIQFICLFITYWLINVGVLLVIYFGKHRKLKDPTLNGPILIWCIITILTVNYLSLLYRGTTILLLVFSLVYGSFKLSLKQYIYISSFSLMGYIMVVLALYKWHPNSINFKGEIVTIFVLMGVLFETITVAWDLSKLRSYLKNKSEDLKLALEKIESLSVLDELTKVKNRRFIMEVLDKQFALCEQDPNYCFSVCIFDIDFFKKINDQFGHLAGDHVLIEFCRALEISLRKNDYFGRFGGEEFILIIPLMEKNKLMEYAERIRTIIEKLVINYEESVLKITVSIGGAQYLKHESIKELLVRADKALYLAKGNGRNRIVIL